MMACAVVGSATVKLPTGRPASLSNTYPVDNVVGVSTCGAGDHLKALKESCNATNPCSDKETPEMFLSISPQLALSVA